MQRPQQFRLSHRSGDYILDFDPLGLFGLYRKGGRAEDDFAVDGDRFELILGDYRRGDIEVQGVLSKVLWAIKSQGDLDSEFCGAYGAGRYGEAEIRLLRRAFRRGHLALRRDRGQSRSNIADSASKHLHLPSEGEKPAAPEEVKLQSIQIVLCNEEGEAIPHADFELVLPDGSRRCGQTNAKGFQVIDGIPAGSCSLRFQQFSADLCSYDGAENLSEAGS